MLLRHILRSLAPIFVVGLLPFSNNAAQAQAPATAPAALDHVALYVADLDRSVAFYRDVFGFHETPAPFPIARWLVLGNGLMLHLVKGRSVPVDNPKWIHMAFAWGPMSETIATLDARKIGWSDIQGRHELQTRPDGVKQIFVQDPDGYWIEINDTLRDVPANPLLIGTWRLISYVDTETGGASVRAFGDAPIGQFVFAADGHAAISIMRNPPAPEKVTSDIDPDACTPAWFCSYFGTYRVDPDGRGWTLHVEGANIPSYMGTDQHRAFQIAGNRMTISETYQVGGKTVRAERVLERAR